MRKLFAVLCYSIMLCLATFAGAHASTSVPDRKVHATEFVMQAPTTAPCVIDTIATAHPAILQPSLGPVAPATLVAVDGGTKYLALIRVMTCPPNQTWKLVSLLGNGEKETDKPHVDPGR